MGWLRLVGSLRLLVSFAKEPYKIDDILQKKPIILRSLLFVATPYLDSMLWSESNTHTYVRTYVPKCSHQSIKKYKYTYLHKYIHILAYIHTYVHTNIHTYIHTCTHTYIHTCIHNKCARFMHIYLFLLSRVLCLYSY